MKILNYSDNKRHSKPKGLMLIGEDDAIDISLCKNIIDYAIFVEPMRHNVENLSRLITDKENYHIVHAICSDSVIIENSNDKKSILTKFDIKLDVQIVNVDFIIDYLNSIGKHKITNNIDTLIINTQNSPLKVLMGAVNLFKQLKYIEFKMGGYENKNEYFNLISYISLLKNYGFILKNLEYIDKQYAEIIFVK